MMKKNLLLLVLCAVTASSALAQTANKFDVHVSNIVLLQDRRVQKELGVNDSQRTKLNSSAKAHDGRVQRYFADLQKRKVDPKTIPNPDPKIVAFMQRLKTEVLGQLSSVQTKRLGQISLQQIGLLAVLDPVVAQKLSIPSTTVKKMQETYAKGQREAFVLQQKAANKVLAPYKDRKPKDQKDAQAMQAKAEKELQAVGKTIQPQVSAIERKTSNSLAALLSATQKKAFTNLAGKPFRPA